MNNILMLKRLYCFLFFILFGQGLHGQPNLVSDPLSGSLTQIISPNGKYALVVAPDGKTNGVLEIKKGVIISTFKGSSMNAVVFLPDNEHLLMTWPELKILNLFTGDTVNKLQFGKKERFKFYENGTRIAYYPASKSDTGFMIMMDPARKRFSTPNEKNDSVWIVGTLGGNSIVKFESDFIEIIDVAARAGCIAILGATKTDTSLAVYNYNDNGIVQRTVMSRITEMIWFPPILTFSNTGKYLTFQSRREKVYNIVEASTGRVLPVFDKFAYQLNFDTNDETLMVYAMQGPQYLSYDKPDNFKVFDPVTQKLLFEQQIPKGQVMLTTILPDAFAILNTLVSWGNEGMKQQQEIQVKSKKNGEIIRIIPLEPGMNSFVVWNKYFIYLKYNIYHQKILAYLDLGNGQIVREIPVLSQTAIQDMDYLPESKKLLLTVNNEIKTLDIENSLRLESLPFDSVRECAVLEKENKIALLRERYPRGLCLSLCPIKGEQVFFSRLIQNEYIRDVQIAPGGKLLSYVFYTNDKAGEKTGTVIVNADNGHEVGRFPTSNQNWEKYGWWSGTGRYFYNVRSVKALPTGIAYQHGTEINNLDLIDSSKLILQKINPEDGRIMANLLLPDGFEKISVSELDDQIVLLTCRNSWTKSICSVTILDEQLAVKKSFTIDDSPFSVYQCYFYPDAEHLTMVYLEQDATKMHKKTYNIETGQRIDQILPGKRIDLYSSPLNLDMVVDLPVTRELNFFDLEKTDFLFSLTFKGVNDYMFLSPDNHYWATRGATNMIRFSKDGLSFPFRQFDLLYNRPDKILARLMKPDTSLIRKYYGAYQERLKKMDIQENALSADVVPPSLQILTPELPFATNDSAILLDISANGLGSQLKQFNIWVNDVPLYGKKGIPIRDTDEGVKTKKLNIPLSTGHNLIQISCTNVNGIESLTAEIDITCNAPAKKSALYLMLIGVSEYQDTSLNLMYAVKDAEDVEKLFTGRRDLYDTIYINRLFDKDATLKNVQNWKTKIRHADINDQIILFYSGHGQQVKNDFYLVSYDIDINNMEEKGISYRILEWLFDSIAARQQLVMLDACESGESDVGSDEAVKKANTQSTPDIGFKSGSTQAQRFINGYENRTDVMKELFTDLRRNTGTVVISAASAIESAKESKEWKNGAFTFCFKRGLDQMEADLNKDKKITVTELQYYLGKSVYEITKGTQKPAFRSENVSNDWRLW